MWLRTYRKKNKRYTPSFLPSSTRDLSHSLICIAQEQQSSISGDFSWNALRTFTYVAELVGFISAPQRSHIRFVAILLALHFLNRPLGFLAGQKYGFADVCAIITQTIRAEPVRLAIAR